MANHPRLRVRRYRVHGADRFKVQASNSAGGWRDIFLSPFRNRETAELFIRRERMTAA